MHKLIDYIIERRQNRERWISALQNATIPLRLTNGLLGPISGAHIVERYKQLIARADVVCIDNVGHYPQVEVPEVVLKSQLDLMEENT